MKRNEQLILGSLAVIGLIAGFWLLVLSPKRNEASQLQSEVDQLKSSLSQAQQDMAAGQQAQKSFRIDYRRMVVLGKAVPADSEQTSLLVQLQNLADRSGVEFQTFDLGDASSAAASAPAPPAPTTDSSSASSSTDSSSTDSSASSTPSSSTTATAAPASEAAVATLPLGAAVGPAGLPIMPYDMTFTGDFFQIADFMERLDGLVHVRDGKADVQGRLLTVDSFTLTPAAEGLSANPDLTAHLSVTTFLTPADQGTTAGATPSGPADSTATLASSTSTSTESTPTATATP